MDTNVEYEEARFSNESNNDDSSDEEERRRKWWLNMMQCEGESSHTNPKPCRTSILRGSMWLDELLHGHPARIKEQLGIGKRAFKQLCNTLVEKEAWIPSPRQRVGVAESLAIFLYTVTGNHRHTDGAERFQHSTSTICHHVKTMARALSSLAPQVIKPRHDNDIHPKIFNDDRFYPWFQVCMND